jgi:hypothetical protein
VEEEELRKVLQKVSTVAGMKDYFNKFKKIFAPKKPVDNSYEMSDKAIDEFVEGSRKWEDPEFYAEGEEVDKSGAKSGPSYEMDEGSIDEFVEGSRKWEDPGHYIEEEANQNAQFFWGVEQLLKEMVKVRRFPNKKGRNSY